MSFNSFLHKWLDGAYCIGIVEASAESIINSGRLPEIHWVQTDNDDTWLADPFIISATPDVITLLAEEYVVAENKGRLSKVLVDRHTYKVISSTTILELPTHLSFPYPISHEGQTYICPETNATSEAAIYSFDGSHCTSPHKIIDGKMLDSQLFTNGGGYCVFSVRASGKGMDDTKLLEIYGSESLFGPYTLIQTIEKPRCEGRGAGSVFTLSDGRIIRPAQNCEGGYGKGVIFFEITRNADGLFSEKEILRFDADPKMKNGLCLHTFSPCGNLVAVDGFDYKSRTIASLAPAIYKFKSYINKILGR